MNEPDRGGTKGWGVKPLILSWIIPIFLVTSVIAVIFNYLMAKENDEKRIADYVHQKRMDLVYLSRLPSLQMYLMNLKLGLLEEAAFLREGVQLYNVNYLKNQKNPFIHTLSLVAINGKELLRVENGKSIPSFQDFSSSGYIVKLRESEQGSEPPLPVVQSQKPEDVSVIDAYPVYSEINNRVIGGMIFKYQIPVQQLMKHSRRVFFFNIVLGILSTVTALVIIFIALGYIIRPLNQLTKATQKMLTGDLSREIEVQGYGETKTLAAAFEDLRMRLEGRIKELGDNARKLEAIIDSLPVATFILDKDRKVIYWNKAIEEMTGLSRQKVLGRGDLQYSEPFYGIRRPVLIDLLFETHKGIEEKYLNLKNPGKGKVEASAWCPALRGGERLLYGTASLLYDEEGEIYGAIESISDMTENYEMEEEKKQLQAQLLHAQKLKAIGTLAGGVAHDFNNIIHAIQGYTDIMLRQRTSDHPDYSKLMAIDKSAKRASELTSQLLLFSRKEKSELRPIDLNQEIRELYNLLQRIIPKMIDIELVLSDDLHHIDADPLQIEQAIVNLAINSRDAMLDGGKITIETENVYLDEKFCELNPGVTPGEQVVVRLSDTGHGMDGETLEHIFEPFYTTKDVGEGTGLGLAMVYGIVENHRGYITCSSELGKGSTFSIYLPASTQMPEVVESEDHGDIAGGSETILLVDDDNIVRSLGQDVLMSYGYKVLVAVDGEGGLEIYKQERERIDLVILDMIMPGMGGKKCLDELLKIDPDIKVIIASGYTHEKIKDEIMGLDNVSFISKPYDIEKLFDLVQQIIGN